MELDFSLGSPGGMASMLHELKELWSVDRSQSFETWSGLLCVSIIKFRVRFEGSLGFVMICKCAI